MGHQEVLKRLLNVNTNRMEPDVMMGAKNGENGKVIGEAATRVFVFLPVFFFLGVLGFRKKKGAANYFFNLFCFLVCVHVFLKKTGAKKKVITRKKIGWKLTHGANQYKSFFSFTNSSEVLVLSWYTFKKIMQNHVDDSHEVNRYDIFSP